MDVKNTFLQGELDEEVYMVQPPGLKFSTYPQAVCRLKKLIYTLKQAPKACHSKITQYLHQISFKMSKSDNTLFVRSNSRGQVFIIIYVDDLVIGGEHLAGIEHIKKLLFCRFEMKDMKELHYFLGIEVIWTLYGTMNSQRRYILNLLYKFGITDYKLSLPLSHEI